MKLLMVTHGTAYPQTLLDVSKLMYSAGLNGRESENTCVLFANHNRTPTLQKKMCSVSCFFHSTLS